MFFFTRTGCKDLGFWIWVCVKYDHEYSDKNRNYKYSDEYRNHEYSDAYS